MTLTLALPPAVEASLMREAVRQGVPLDIYALRVLEQHVLPQSRSDPRSPSSPLQQHAVSRSLPPPLAPPPLAPSRSLSPLAPPNTRTWPQLKKLIERQK